MVRSKSESPQPGDSVDPRQDPGLAGSLIRAGNAKTQPVLAFSHARQPRAEPANNVARVARVRHSTAQQVVKEYSYKLVSRGALPRDSLGGGYHRVSPYARRERSTSRAGVAAAVTEDRVWAARRDRYRRQRSETGSSRPTARSRVGRAGHAAPARRQTEKGGEEQRGNGRAADGEHRATDRPVRELRGQSKLGSTRSDEMPRQLRRISRHDGTRAMV